MLNSLPATVTTVERFPSTTTKEDIAAKVALNVAAGAVKASSSMDQNTQDWLITTVWNVIGGNA